MMKMLDDDTVTFLPVNFTYSSCCWVTS